MKKFSEYLTEAVEQLDELSKDTLGRYVKKASLRNVINSYGAGENQENDGSRAAEQLTKAIKRNKNIGKAVDKLTKK